MALLQSVCQPTNSLSYMQRVKSYFVIMIQSDTSACVYDAPNPLLHQQTQRSGCIPIRAFPSCGVWRGGGGTGTSTTHYHAETLSIPPPQFGHRDHTHVLQLRILVSVGNHDVVLFSITIRVLRVQMRAAFSPSPPFQIPARP